MENMGEMITRNNLPRAPSRAPSTPSSGSNSETDSVARPSLYVHEPRARPAPFEQYYGHIPPNHIEILSELKSSKMEGIYNLSFLILLVSLLNLFISNIVENGFRGFLSDDCIDKLFKDSFVSILLLFPLPIPFLLSYILVIGYSRKTLTGYTMVMLHASCLVIQFVIWSSLMFSAKLNPLFGGFHGILHVVVALKQHSYVFTNLLLAEETEKKKQAKSLQQQQYTTTTKSTTSLSSLDSRPREGNGNNNNTSNMIVYPRNLTFGNYCYFVLAPILVYETNYPKTNNIRPRYVFWYCLQIILCLVIQYILLMQFCIPLWKSSTQSDRLLLFVLKLGVPSFIIWLLMFWGFFHCALNVLAEITRFADRQFYKEWWNSTTLHQFWRTWNVLVHEWCVRHLYVESVTRHNVNTRTAAFGTFFMSALLHEYVCVVAFRIIRPYMFFGMMAQIPLMKMSNKLAGSRNGNLLMWTLFFLGQPVIALLYFRDYINSWGTLLCY